MTPDGEGGYLRRTANGKPGSTERRWRHMPIAPVFWPSTSNGSSACRSPGNCACRCVGRPEDRYEHTQRLSRTPVGMGRRSNC
jgi:hypothetical protein